ncbi:hypothetical protein LTR22_013524 [Elasticomyces elasticus]|nr:hypothetical protein LTR22_013524 [Elasticomyces elasticus]KAK4922403.1 hypothetical protein LTR49_010268 [Elasticomyces elasticus]KAK5765284.1 hypothetical protein LTS12_004541 [Elasticomyces elasticus]
MISSKLPRAATRAITTTPSCTAPTATALSRPTGHQRRASSSKTSCPPDDSSSKPAPASKAVEASTARGGDEAAEVKKAFQRLGKKSGSRVPRRTGTGTTLPTERGSGKRDVEKEKQVLLPSVPGLGYLSERDPRARDTSLSSFFSLHRPLSLTSTIPPSTTTEHFNSLFQQHNHQHSSTDQWAAGNSAQGRPEDVIYSLHSAIESLESSANVVASTQEDSHGVRWEVLQESPSNAENQHNGSNGPRHLDGQPMKAKTLEEVVATMRPYHAPPPPQSFVEAASSKIVPVPRTKKMASGVEGGKVKTKTYQTTITVHETTAKDGRKSYSAESSPIISVREPSQKQTASALATSSRSSKTAVGGIWANANVPYRPSQPFRHRMLRRGRMYLQSRPAAIGDGSVDKTRFIRRAPSGKRVTMMLISVKRQRKLKMKKHKYKKLMKRTRNLRRRLDRN